MNFPWAAIVEKRRWQWGTLPMSGLAKETSHMKLGTW